MTSKRRKGYPSETNVKRGKRIVHGNKQLKGPLTKPDCFMLAEIAPNSFEDRRNRITITSHFKGV